MKNNFSFTSFLVVCLYYASTATFAASGFV